jgi:hypothetical protein
MKRYAAIEGYGVRIGGGRKTNKETSEILKRTYLCRHSGKANSNRTVLIENQHLNATSCRVECPWKVNIWNKKSKGHLEVTTLHNQHIGHEFHPSAGRFVLTLRKLPEEVIQEIRFLTVVAKADVTIQYRIIREKFNIKVIRQDLYNAISKFRHEITPGETDTEILLRRLYDKKMENPRWVISLKLNPITSSLTHLF